MDKRQQALAIIASISGEAVENIDPGMHLTADLGIDSPKALRLLLRLEDDAGIVIDDEEAASMRTVGDVLGHVETTDSGS